LKKSASGIVFMAVATTNNRASAPVVFISGEPLQNLHRPQERMTFVAKPFVQQILLDAIMAALPNVKRQSA